MGPVVGALSDKSGRRKLWLVGMLSLQTLPFAVLVAAVFSAGVGDSRSPFVVWAYTVSDAIFGASSPAMCQE